MKNNHHTLEKILLQSVILNCCGHSNIFVVKHHLIWILNSQAKQTTNLFGPLERVGEDYALQEDEVGGASSGHLLSVGLLLPVALLDLDLGHHGPVGHHTRPILLHT